MNAPSPYRPVLARFRGGWAIVLQTTATMGMLLQPLTASAYWSSSTSSYVDDPPRTLIEYSPDTAEPISVPNPWWSNDDDSDGLTNEVEVEFGSDPYWMDTDSDGLSDSDERNYSHTDPRARDSDCDGHTDYDEYYNPNGTLVNYLTIPGFYSYFDADGDGIDNISDPTPDDIDRDLDGIYNWSDPSPDPQGYWYGDEFYPGLWVDTDLDTIPDPFDPYPEGSYFWSGREYPLPFVDSDKDGLPNSPIDADPFPNQAGQYSWKGVLYPGYLRDHDADSDSIPDEFDVFPGIQGQYEYNGVIYPGNFCDADGDTVPDPADPYPNPGDEFVYQGQLYVTVQDDKDRDGVPNALDPLPNPGDGYWYPGSKYDGGTSIEYPEPKLDRDDDGIPDPAEVPEWINDPENGLDTDGDGLTNYQERTIHNTNPMAVDTDGDGLTDKEEIVVFGTNPLQQKTDPNQTKTDFQMVVGVDTDADGIPDHIENYYRRLGYGMNSLDSADGRGDLDGDGFTNLHAYLNGWDLTGNLAHYDSDGDGMSNAAEAAHPLLLNMWDFYDSVLDSDGDGLLNFEEVQYDLNLLDTSTHGEEPDLDYVNRTANRSWSRPVRPGDTDGDGMTDGWEHWYKLDVRLSADANGDPDGDLLINLREFQTWRNPQVKDYRQEADTSATDSGLIDPSLIPPAYTHHELPPLPAGTGNCSSTVDFAITRFEDASDNVIVEVMKTVVGDSGGQYTGGTRIEETVPIFCYPDPPEDADATGLSECPCHHGTRGRFKRTPPFHEEHWEHDLDEDGEWEYFEGEPPDPTDCLHYKRVANHLDGTAWELEENVTCSTWEEAKEFLPDGGSGGTGGGGGTRTAPGVYLNMRIRINSNWAGDQPLMIRDGCKISTYASESGSGPTVAWEDLYILKGSRTSAAVSAMVTEGKRVILEFVPPASGSPDSSPSPLSAADNAGSRYRKVAFNGLPLPDSKPQVQNENGEPEEETYIDAYSSQLRHSVTDVYVTDPALLTPLMVRRDLGSDSWNDRGGLRPNERVAEPFGPCWSSNLCSFVRFDEGGGDTAPSAEVVDEMGTRQRFFFTGASWAHDALEHSDVKTRFNTFTAARSQVSLSLPNLTVTTHSHSGIVLRKKFGTTCYYEMISPTGLHQVTSPDRIKHEGEARILTFARLIRVEDRYGNQLDYTYPDDLTLIPSKISDPARAGHVISIQQDLGRVVKVRGPVGEVTEYLYTASHDPALGLTSYSRAPASPTLLLTGVRKGRSLVNYAYHDSAETEIDPSDSTRITKHTSLELAAITNELGAVFRFEHRPNTAVDYFDGESARRQYGLPMLLVSVTPPALSPGVSSGRLEIATTRRIGWSGDYLAPDFYTAFTWRDGAEARTYRYDFSVARKIQITAHGLQPDCVSFVFTKMALKAPDNGVETYEFDVTRSCALAKVTDRSGFVTSFTYGADGFDDPLAEINPTGTSKSFTYHSGTRVLSSTTDLRGIKTAYAVDALGRRTSETIKHPAGTVPGGSSKTWTYDTAFKGFVTSETWDTAVPRTAADPTTALFPAIKTIFNYAPQSSGLGWWRTLTETIEGTALADGSGKVTTTTICDFSGNKRSVTDGRGLTTKFDYDERGRLIKATHPDGTFKVLDYDARGNVVLEVDETGVYRFHEYDTWNRRIRSTVDMNGNRTPDASYTTVTWDVAGLCHYDGDLVTETRYNSMNLIVEEIDARGVITEHTYDAIGRCTGTKVCTRTQTGVTTVHSQVSQAYKVSGVNGGLEAGSSAFDISGFKPVQTTDARGGVTKYTYDKLCRQLMVQRPDNSYVHTTFDKAGNVTSTCDPTQTLAPAQSITTGDPEANKRLTQTDSTIVAFTGLAVTHTFYDALGAPTKVEYPNGKNATTLNTFFGKPYQTKDETGLYNHVAYDVAGRPVKAISSALSTPNETTDPVTLKAYDEAGNIIRVRDPLGNITESFYDARNRAVKVAAPEVVDALAPGQTVARPVTITAFDAAGRVTAVIDPLGNTTRKFYDAAGRHIATVDARDQVSTTEYDAGGRITAVVDAKGQRVTNTYDELGRLLTTTDAEEIVNSFAYDAAGNRTRLTDGSNQSCTFEYDALNRLTRQVFANGDDWIYAYNAVNKISETDPLGRTYIHQYDVRNRLEKTYYSTFARDPVHDAHGRIIKVTELGTTADKTVEYTYDSRGRVLTEKSVGVTHTYDYDKAGNRTAVTYADGRRIGTSYDALNRPVTITDDNGTANDPTDNRVTKYGYDRAGRTVELVAANGQVTRNTYDELGRLTARVLYRSTTQMDNAGRLASFTWSHDALGNVLSQTEYWFASGSQPARSRGTAMTYDGVNRLLSETVTEPGVAQVTTLYSYDAANNRRTKTVSIGDGIAPAGLEIGHWTYGYNTANQLVRVDKRPTPTGTIIGGASYTYDANGNRLTKVVDGTIAVTYRTTNYTWDMFGRMATITHPISTSARQMYTYTYDYRTRRTGIARGVATGSAARHTAVVFSGGVSVAEYERATNTLITGIKTTTAPTVPTVEYTRGADMGGGVGGLLSTLRNPLNTSGVPVNPTTTMPATLRYNLSNGRGDIVAQSDGAGALTWTASYEAYGKRTEETGTNTDKQRANTKDEDPTGLLNEGFRYRDLETGVWLSRDPAGFVDGPNLYAYVKQNPWSAFDPHGLAEKRAKAKVAPEAKLYHVTGDPGDPTTVKFDPVKDPSKINGKNARIWINGMANDDKHAAELGLLHTGWTDFYMIHNPTQGGVRDLGECSLQKLGFDTKVAKTTKAFLSQFDLKSATIVAHSQGTMIMNKALSDLHKEGVDMRGISLSYHGSAANVLTSNVLARRIGGLIANFEGHSLDAVHNVIGMNTINPLRIAGSLLATPLLFRGRDVSPHSTPQGGAKLPEVFSSSLFHP